MKLEYIVWLQELDKAHNRSLDYLINSWTEKDKYDKQIMRIKYEEWHEKYEKILERFKPL